MTASFHPPSGPTIILAGQFGIPGFYLILTVINLTIFAAEKTNLVFSRSNNGAG
jgi:hypothetical protein